MTREEQALLVIAIGGVVLSITLGLLSSFVQRQFADARHRIDRAREEREWHANRTDEGVAAVRHATDLLREVLTVQRIEHESRAAMQRIDARRARRAAIMRICLAKRRRDVAR